MKHERAMIKSDVEITGFKCPKCYANVPFSHGNLMRFNEELTCGLCNSIIDVRYTNKNREARKEYLKSRGIGNLK